jgi:UDP-N-acetylmuramyl tripeptide synthase
VDAAGISLRARTPWGSARIVSPALGRFNASNLLGTLSVLLASGITLRRAVAALARLQPLPGRMQRVGGGARPLVVVDYAHTPDALEKVLRSLRELMLHQSRVSVRESRLICVFGCGGERDRGKRPQMGRIATRFADSRTRLSRIFSRARPRAGAISPSTRTAAAPSVLPSPPPGETISCSSRARATSATRRSWGCGTPSPM